MAPRPCVAGNPNRGDETTAGWSRVSDDGDHDRSHLFRARPGVAVKSTLQPGLTGSLTYEVTADRIVPRLLPEAPEFAVLPAVLATGYLVAIIEWRPQGGGRAPRRR